jgi:hypothetical protein
MLGSLVEVFQMEKKVTSCDTFVEKKNPFIANHYGEKE